MDSSMGQSEVVLQPVAAGGSVTFIQLLWSHEEVVAGNFAHNVCHGTPQYMSKHDLLSVFDDVSYHTDSLEVIPTQEGIGAELLPIHVETIRIVNFHGGTSDYFLIGDAGVVGVVDVKHVAEPTHVKCVDAPFEAGRDIDGIEAVD